MSTPPQESRRLTAIMVTDMVGYSSLSQHDQHLALELLEEHHGILRAAFARHGGVEAKTTGDGFIVAFDSALTATACAAAIQQTLDVRNRAVPPERALRIRIGLHVGELIHRQGDVLGDAVNLACRIQTTAPPGGITVSQQVRDQLQNQRDFRLRSRGRQPLKNIREPQTLYDIDLPWNRRAGLARIVPLLPGACRAVVIAVVLAVLGFAGWRLTRPLDETPSPGPATPATPRTIGRTTVAVMPLQMLGGGEDNQHIADGLTDELINRLGRVEGLRVKAGRPLVRDRDARSPPGPRFIGERLAVGSVLEGSVRLEGELLRLTVRLTDAATEELLWPFDRDFARGNLLSVQSEFALEVARRLKGELLEKEQRHLGRRPTESEEAFDLYFRGRYLSRLGTRNGFRQATNALTRAIQLDPDFALAHAGLAGAYIEANEWLLAPRVAMPAARKAAERALALDPELAETHVAMGRLLVLYHYDWDGARSHFQQALELAPRDGSIRAQYAWFLSTLSQWPEALGHWRAAEQLEPHSAGVKTAFASALYHQHDYDEALRKARQALAEEPDRIGPYVLMAYVHSQAGRLTEALAAIAEARRIDDGPDVEALEGYIRARAGDLAAATRILERLRNPPPEWSDRYLSPYHVALILRGLDRRAEAIESLEATRRERSGWLIGIEGSPVWEAYRSDPGFQRIAARLGGP
jgi:class 3 adenylate cyclase/TolB-like protein/Tfp pilus assembly protein PilF